ncbi:hypothetical protein GCM10009567_15780 [Rothia amarae]
MSAEQSPTVHQEFISVRGAHQNNLKNVDVEIPKRQLTVFTGVSGSGKSSLVFGTIAAESQWLINETHPAFVQGFMSNLPRPEVDILEGLTTAIVVDQERMGGNPRSTVGTATDATALLRILFSRVAEPSIGGPNAYSLNVATVSAQGARTAERWSLRVLLPIWWHRRRPSLVSIWRGTPLSANPFRASISALWDARLASW